MSETAAGAILSIEQLTLALPAEADRNLCRRGGLARAAPAAEFFALWANPVPANQ